MTPRRASPTPPPARLPPQLVACTPDTPLIDALSLIVRERVHHVFVVDAVAGRPLACVGTTDVLRLALAPPAWL